MRRGAVWACAALFASGVAAMAAPQFTQENNEALRKKLKDIDLVGRWIYDDVKAGFAEAKKTRKPLLVVFR